MLDSFQVYIGVPVNDNAVSLSNGTSVPVYDPQRRWFSEVLRIWDGAHAPYFEVKSAAGSTPSLADTTGFSTFSGVIPTAQRALHRRGRLEHDGQGPSRVPRQDEQRWVTISMVARPQKSADVALRRSTT